MNNSASYIKLKIVDVERMCDSTLLYVQREKERRMEKIIKDEMNKRYFRPKTREKALINLKSEPFPNPLLDINMYGMGMLDVTKRLLKTVKVAKANRVEEMYVTSTDLEFLCT